MSVYLVKESEKGYILEFVDKKEQLLTHDQIHYLTVIGVTFYREPIVGTTQMIIPFSISDVNLGIAIRFVMHSYKSRV